MKEHQLEAIKDLLRTQDRCLQHAVGEARRVGCSWSDIGEALGCTKQAAWARFADTGDDIDNAFN